MTRQQFVAFVLFEQKVELLSEEPASQVLAHLKQKTLTPEELSPFSRSNPAMPLTGYFQAERNMLRHRDPLFTLPGSRRFVFRVDSVGTGSRLVGVLRLRPMVVAYEIYCVAGTLLLQLWMIYLFVRGLNISWTGARQIAQQVLLLPFCWLFIRAAIWGARKKERRMLAILQDAVSRS